MGIGISEFRQSVLPQPAFRRIENITLKEELAVVFSGCMAAL